MRRRSVHVGYAQNGLKQGFTMVTPQFVDVVNSAMDIQNLNATGDDTSDTVYIQTLDESGRTVNSYTWNDWAADTPCWVNDDYELVEGVAFAPGAGLWVQGLSESQAIRFTAPEL